MRVLHVIDSGGLYGAETMLLHLMKALHNFGVESILASIGSLDCGDKPIEIEARRRDLPVKVFRMRPGLNWPGALSILQFAHSHGIQLLHSHGYKGNIFFGLLPKSLRKLPLVTTVHGWTWTGGWSRMSLYEWLDGVSLRYIDRVFLVNKSIQIHPWIARLKNSKVVVIANGIPCNSLQSNSFNLRPEIIEFTRKGFSVVAIGRLSPEKNFASLILAISELIREGLDVRLAILGEGGLRGELHKMASELCISDHVYLSGYLENAKDYLIFFNIFCMPSLTEGLPMVLLEAMAAGIPIVASHVGGIPDVLDHGHAGLLVRSGDLQALKKAIVDIINNPNAASKRAKNAFSRVQNKYSSEVMGKNYFIAYQEVLSDIQKKH